MNFLSTLVAVAVSSSNPTPASQSCAAYILEHPGSAAEQSMMLSPSQKSRLEAARYLSRQRTARLEQQIKRLKWTIANAQRDGANRYQMLQLKRQLAELMSQLKGERARGAAKINALLSPWQRKRCAVSPKAYRRGGPATTNLAAKRGDRSLKRNKARPAVTPRVKIKMRKVVGIQGELPKKPTVRVKLPPKPGPYRPYRYF